MSIHDSNKPLDALTVKRHKEGIIADAAPHRGLRLHANANGTKTWVYRYRGLEKKLKQIKLGDYPAMGLAEARAAYIEQKAIKHKFGDPREFRENESKKRKEAAAHEKAQGYLVSEMVEHYLIEHIARHRIEKGQIECRRMLKADVVPTIGMMQVNAVRRSHIHELIQQIARRAPRIAGMVKAELKSAFEHAISAGRVSEEFANPVFGVKAPKHTARKRTFSDQELVAFLKWLPGSPISNQVKSALWIMLLTGCRGGEVVSTMWKNIDFDRGELHFPTTKNGLAHIVFLSTQAVQVFRSIERGKSPYVFPSPTSQKHISQHAIVWQLLKYREDLGVDHWTSHDIRRTVGTGLAKLGCSRVIQDRILNHVDSSVSGIYDRHSYDNEAREWWQKWADYLQSLNGISLPLID